MVRSVSVRTKIGVLCGAVLGFLLLAVAGVYAWVLLPSIADIERHEARVAMARAVDEVEAQIETLDMTVHDWASWTDSLDFVAGRYDRGEYEKVNLPPKAFEMKFLELVAFVDATGGVVWAKAYDAGTGELRPVPDLAPYGIPTDHALRRLVPVGERVAGILSRPGGPALAVARPITDSDEEAEPSGMLIMTQAIDVRTMTLISKRIGSPVAIELADPDAPSPESPAIREIDKDTLGASAGFHDVDGVPAFVLKTQLPREVMAANDHALRIALPLSGLIVLSAMLVLLGAVDRLVAAPLVRMHATVSGMSEAFEPVELPVDLRDRKDEIGWVARAVSRMHRDLVLTAHQDALTGLANRAMLRERAEDVLAAARREKRMAAVLIVDLDGFKPVNDTHGHDAGDAVLVEVAWRLRAAVREEDLVARVGGDEFAIVCARVADGHDAQGIGDRIVSAFAEPFALPAGGETNVGCTVGVSLFPEHGEALEALVKRADQAMYVAKKGGKNHARLFGGGDSEA